MSSQGKTTPVVAASLLKARAGRRDELVELLTELAQHIHAEPGGTHYSVHRPLGGDADGPLLVIQACASADAFKEHALWVRTHVPRLAALLETPPNPPVLYEPVPLGGPVARESFSG